MTEQTSLVDPDGGVHEVTVDHLAHVNRTRVLPWAPPFDGRVALGPGVSGVVVLEADAAATAWLGREVQVDGGRGWIIQLGRVGPRRWGLQLPPETQKRPRRSRGDRGQRGRWWCMRRRGGPVDAGEQGQSSSPASRRRARRCSTWISK